MAPQATTKKVRAPRKRTKADFGLTSSDVAARSCSIGASDTRIICNGTDEQIENLWRQKRGLDTPNNTPDDFSNNIHAQFGHYIETFHRMWFEGRANTTITRVNNRIDGEGELYGSHVTLDGFINALEPFDTGAQDFELMWTCPKPSGPVAAIWEGKWRNSYQFVPDEQTATFLPQLHQAMAFTRVDYAVISTFTSNLKIIARVVRFDDSYWTKVRARVEAFAASVKAGTMPEKFSRLNAKANTQRTILRSQDMTTTSSANVWAFYANELLSAQPSPEEKTRLAKIEKAKKELKTTVGKDIGTASGNGIVAKRDARGALSFTNIETGAKL